MLKRSHRVQESLVRYWAQQAMEMYGVIGDDSMQPQLEAVQQALAAMEGDRRVIVMGGERCGKTSLLSYVAGLPVIRSGRQQESPYLRWRYGNDDGDTERSRFLPLNELQGIEFVDTGNCAEQEVQEELLRLLPGSDAAVVVVDARNGEQSPAWAVLEQLPINAVANVLVALTFTDKIPAAEALALSARIREMCRERLRLVVLVCNVCPTSEQGVEMFVTRVQETLDSPEGARRAIRNALEATGRLMTRQSGIINARTAAMRDERGFLGSIENEINTFLSHQLDGVDECAADYSTVPKSVLPALLRKLRRSFGRVLSPVALMQLEEMGAGAETSLYRLICKGIIDKQKESDTRFVSSCQAHWRSVRPRMKEAIECEISEFPQDVLEAELNRLRRQLEHELYQPFANLRIRSSLDTGFTAHLGWMQGMHTMLCVFLSLAGLCGVLGFDTFALWMLGFMLLVWLCGAWRHMRALAKLGRSITREAETLDGAMHELMPTLVRNMVVSRVGAYRRLYAVAGHRVQEYVEKLHPLQERHNAILRELRTTAPRI